MEVLSSPSPLGPPHSEDERLAWLRLLRSRRVGVSTFFRLLSEHGSAIAALDALPGVARGAGVTGYTPFPEAQALDELRRGALAGARLLAIGSPDYPAALADIPDPPPLLWAIGRVELLARPLVSLVGARNASSLGLRMARSLAAGLGAAGFVTVSGLARGIDTAVHGATLETGTVAVVAGGVDVVYPAENAALSRSIGETGLLLSEQPMGLAPQARHFARRNRIISGLSGAVVVVEASAKSGSLITARDALDQGREVLAVPGHPFDARAAGANMLIRDGATLVRGPRDVLNALGEPAARTHDALPDAAAPKTAPGDRTTVEASALHRRILDRLGPSPTSEDHLIRELSLPAATVTAGIVTLEIEGLIARQPGGFLTRAG